MANVILGLVALAFGLWGLSIWWWSVVEVVRGIVPVAAIIFGLVAIGAGVARMREGSGDDEDDEDEMEDIEVATAAGTKSGNPS